MVDIAVGNSKIYTSSYVFCLFGHYLKWYSIYLELEKKICVFKRSALNLTITIFVLDHIEQMPIIYIGIF